MGRSDVRLAADRTFSSIFPLSIGRRRSILIKCGMPHFIKMGFFMRLLWLRVTHVMGQRIDDRREGFHFSFSAPS